ncbi:MAG: hypothetical protein CVU18_05795 [Betaproteobacteria bacterium HGW-Betaproteobacteria-12]|nr:MAG: hypothetical protein CVU18_05795 [Betaproteobacteria bacterium HGW-Betaproteobacteria-12]
MKKGVQPNVFIIQVGHAGESVNRETSIYLDIVRVSAALIVFFGHISGQRLTGGVLWQFGPFMDDAVVIFFVLSGFVIAHVVSVREQSLQSYAIARAARMYSVALPALFLTFVLDALGKTISPELYSTSWGYVDKNNLLRFASGLMFLNQIWYSNISIGSVLPYWSLGFEVWYYIIFGIAYFSSVKYRLLLLTLCCLIVGPRIIILLPLWLSGFYAYKLISTRQPAFGLSLTLFLLSVVLYLFYWYDLRLVIKGVDVPWFLGDNVLTRYTVGLLFTIHLVGFAGISSLFRSVFARFEMQIRWFAGATFTIYLFHLPVAQFLSAVVPWPPEAWETRLVVMGGSFVVMFVIAEYSERKKQFWINLISDVHEKFNGRIKNNRAI